MPNFNFDIDTQSFDVAPLSFIHTKQNFITVAESIALNNAVISRQDNPEFFEDYLKLWKWYCQDKVAWKELCTLIPKLSVAATFQKDNERYDKFNFILPTDCRPSVERILDALKKENIITESRVIPSTTSAVRVYITASGNLLTIFEKFFSLNIYELTRTADLQINQVDRQKIEIGFHSLRVDNLHVENRKVITLLKNLQKDHYIIDVTIENCVVSFTYATREIKKLFTAPNRILQAYFYHKTLSNGTFDDIACDVTCNVSDQEFIFDCFATKGFQTFLINFSSDKKIFSKINQDVFKNSRIINVDDSAENVDVDLILASI